MSITPRMFGAAGRFGLESTRPGCCRAVSLGIDPARLLPGKSPTVKRPVLTIGDP